MAYVDRARLLLLDPQRARVLPAGWGELDEGVVLSTPGLLRQRFVVSEGGRYRVWLKGDFARPVEVAVDGRALGEVGYQSGNEGNFGTPLDVTLRPGRHVLAVERGGGGLRPGDGGVSRLLAVAVEPVGAAASPRTLDPDDWRLLCGRRIDWVEVVRAARP